VYLHVEALFSQTGKMLSDQISASILPILDHTVVSKLLCFRTCAADTLPRGCSGCGFRRSSDRGGLCLRALALLGGAITLLGGTLRLTLCGRHVFLVLVLS
jgi:hypothetical protein